MPVPVLDTDGHVKLSVLTSTYLKVIIRDGERLRISGEVVGIDTVPTVLLHGGTAADDSVLQCEQEFQAGRSMLGFTWDIQTYVTDVCECPTCCSK